MGKKKCKLKVEFPTWDEMTEEQHQLITGIMSRAKLHLISASTDYYYRDRTTELSVQAIDENDNTKFYFIRLSDEGENLQAHTTRYLYSTDSIYIQSSNVKTYETFLWHQKVYANLTESDNDVCDDVIYSDDDINDIVELEQVCPVTVSFIDVSNNKEIEDEDAEFIVPETIYRENFGSFTAEYYWGYDHVNFENQQNTNSIKYVDLVRSTSLLKTAIRFSNDANELPFIPLSRISKYSVKNSNTVINPTLTPSVEAVYYSAVRMIPERITVSPSNNYTYADYTDDQEITPQTVHIISEYTPVLLNKVDAYSDDTSLVQLNSNGELINLSDFSIKNYLTELSSVDWIETNNYEITDLEYNDESIHGIQINDFAHDYFIILDELNSLRQAGSVEQVTGELSISVMPQLNNNYNCIELLDNNIIRISGTNNGDHIYDLMTTADFFSRSDILSKVNDIDRVILNLTTYESNTRFTRDGNSNHFILDVGSANISAEALKNEEIYNNNKLVSKHTAILENDYIQIYFGSITSFGYYRSTVYEASNVSTLRGYAQNYAETVYLDSNRTVPFVPDENYNYIVSYYDSSTGSYTDGKASYSRYPYTSFDEMEADIPGNYYPTNPIYIMIINSQGKLFCGSIRNNPSTMQSELVSCLIHRIPKS